MKDLLYEMLKAFAKCDYEEAKRLYEKIAFEYEVLNNIINKNARSYFDTLRIMSAEITRLECENKELKNKNIEVEKSK